MSSLAMRLRVRSDSGPRYRLDESDDESDFMFGKSKTSENIEKFVRDDAKEGSCNACGESGNLFVCETCTYEYHPKCLLPPLKAPLPTTWNCPKCVNPLNEIEKILDCEMRRLTVDDDSDASKLGSKQIFVKQYLVKWKGLSYLHCTWVPEKEFIKAYNELPRLRTKVDNFRKQMPVGNSLEDDFVPIRPEYTMVDRVLARRQGDEEKEYYVKWVGLSYDECYWELESDISSFQQQIENFNRLQARYRKLRIQKSNIRDGIDSKNKSKEFQQFEKSPEFLLGGELHPYQLEGLNFLRFSWFKQTHAVLADEMGLGKTIQSIAFLASLCEDNVSPHLVIAPISTLRNWEREFATWAPDMNVVMYAGSVTARYVIREFEFYFPTLHKKDKEKKLSNRIGESKQKRIKFDVLLTSYEMINVDNGSLKAINWETMIVDEGHRLKNKNSRLYSSLKEFNTRHRTLLTRTPLQDNLDEPFMLHVVDAGKRPEQELGDRNATRDAGSGLTTSSKATQITNVDSSRGKRLQSSADKDMNPHVNGSNNGTQVIAFDKLHQDSPHVEHEIIITQTHKSEDGAIHQKRKRTAPPPPPVVKKSSGLLEGSSSLCRPDHYGNSLDQASAGTTTDYQQDWPFIKRSPMWATIELYSQKPHFAPLKEINEDYREGFAIAHIITFGNLVQRLSDFKPNDPVDMFNNSLAALSVLETHGFDVGPIRGRLNQLLSLKTKMFEQEATRKEVVKELEKCKCEKSLVEKEMQVLKSKLEQIASKLKAKEEQLMRLQTNNLELDFEMLAATPL